MNNKTTDHEEDLSLSFIGQSGIQRASYIFKYCGENGADDRNAADPYDIHFYSPNTFFTVVIRVPAFSIMRMNTITMPATERSTDCSSLPERERI